MAKTCAYRLAIHCFPISVLRDSVNHPEYKASPLPEKGGIVVTQVAGFFIAELRIAPFSNHRTGPGTSAYDRRSELPNQVGGRRALGNRRAVMVIVVWPEACAFDIDRNHLTSMIPAPRALTDEALAAVHMIRLSAASLAPEDTCTVCRQSCV